jgi:hypothetical protein
MLQEVAKIQEWRLVNTVEAWPHPIDGGDPQVPPHYLLLSPWSQMDVDSNSKFKILQQKWQ